jgi:hypothetical protein
VTDHLGLDKLREKAQAAPRKNWRLRKSFHGPKYAWVSWGDEAEGLGTADLDVPAARYIAAADPTTVLALIDRLQRVETALRQLINDHLDTCDDTCEAAEIARAALEGGSE